MAVNPSPWTTVGVKFDGTPKHYTYKTGFTHKMGDKVVVKVGDTYKTVTVVRLDAEPYLHLGKTYPYKWIQATIADELPESPPKSKSVTRYEAGKPPTTKLYLEGLV